MFVCKRLEIYHTNIQYILNFELETSGCEMADAPPIETSEIPNKLEPLREILIVALDPDPPFGIKTHLRSAKNQSAPAVSRLPRV